MKLTIQWKNLLVCGLALALMITAPLGAHDEPAVAIPADRRPAIFRDVGIEQRLGIQLPAAAIFRDATGARVAIGDYFAERPSILVFSYFDCPMLCPLVLDGLVRSVKPLALEIGRDFDVIVVSIDERDGIESAQAKKSEYVRRYGRDRSVGGWHFLTGDKQEIETITRHAGFNYGFDEATGQFVHASGIFVLTASGKIARVLYGVDYPPKDVRLALVEAGNGEIGTFVDQLLLYCHRYDPATGQYGLIVMNSLRLAGAATVLALISYIGLSLRRERRARGVEAET